MKNYLTHILAGFVGAAVMAIICIPLASSGPTAEEQLYYSLQILKHYEAKNDRPTDDQELLQIRAKNIKTAEDKVRAAKRRFDS